jgi:tetratricopeptide (TPR) repeat protein
MMRIQFRVALSAFALALAISCARAPLSDADLREFSAAVSAYQSGDFRLAIGLAEKLEAKRPDFPKVFILRAKAAWFSGDIEGALAAIDKALVADQGDQEAVLWKSRILRAAGRPDEADKTVSEAMGKDPEDFRLLFLKAQLLLDRGETGAAIAFMDRALESGAELALVYLERGRVAYLLGRKDEALEYLETAKALSKGSKEGANAIDDLIKRIGEK